MFNPLRSFKFITICYDGDKINIKLSPHMLIYMIFYGFIFMMQYDLNKAFDIHFFIGTIISLSIPAVLMWFKDSIKIYELIAEEVQSVLGETSKV